MAGDLTKTHLLLHDLENPHQDRSLNIKGLKLKNGPAALPLSSEPPATGPCVCGIRPEHLFVEDESVTSDVRFSGQIDVKESLGSDTLYHIQYGPQKQPLTVRSKDHNSLSPGDRVDLGFSWKHCHFLIRTRGSALHFLLLPHERTLVDF